MSKTVEEQLKDEILKRYKSISAFTAQIGIPNSSLSSVFKRGIGNAGIASMLKVFDALDLDIESVNTGTLCHRQTIRYGNDHHISDEAIKIAINYDKLDDHGKEMVDIVLEKETARMEQEKPKRIITLPMYELNAEELKPQNIIWLKELWQAASAGYGQYADDDIYDKVPVEENWYTRKADYLMRVVGDSMEPEIHDGDRLLIRDQPAVELGEIGIIIHDSERFVKKYRGSYWESINPDYPDIQPNNETRCIGKVLCRLEPDWLAE